MNDLIGCWLLGKTGELAGSDDFVPGDGGDEILQVKRFKIGDILERVLPEFLQGEGGHVGSGEFVIPVDLRMVMTEHRPAFDWLRRQKRSTGGRRAGRDRSSRRRCRHGLP